MFEIFTSFADLTTYTLLDLKKDTPLTDAIHFFIEDTTKILFLLTTLMMLIGFARSWISSDKIRHWLEGKPKALGYILAVCLGAITPFCSCSSIPLFIAFLSSGIPLGVAMAFLIASPMVNEVAAILFGEAIGWTFTLAYLSTGMIVGMIGGMLIDGLKLDKWMEPFVFESSSPSTCTGTGKCTGKNASPKITIKNRIDQAWQETADLIKKVWPYLFVGVAIGGFIHGYVPQEWFLTHAGADNIFAVPLAVIMAIPLYSNVTGTIPIAEVLIAKGLPVGTTLAFIMSTVAISLPELVILRKVLRPQMLIFFILYLTLAFIILGYGFNGLF